MCTLSSLFIKPMSLMMKSPTSRAKYVSKKMGRSPSSNNASKRFADRRMLFNGIDNSMHFKNKTKDRLFDNYIIKKYPVFKNRLIPEYKLNYFLEMLRQHEPRSPMYQHQYKKESAKTTQSSPFKFIQNKQSENPNQTKAFRKSSKSRYVLEPALKFGMNLWKRFFPMV